jgi:hypothetical protein
MSDYDFSTLNSTDLEELVCDLLNAEQPQDSQVQYKTFKEGKDKGIDFLYSTDTEPYNHIGQVKHYYRTGYDGLYSHLKKSEVAKVKKLDPNRYIFATSVDLSISNTGDISGLFSPYIKSLADIYGKKDLNRIIEKHDKVLTNHYKLWFSDATILQKILISDLEFRSSYFNEKELKRRLRIYVKTPIFDKAREFLLKNNFIIITGDPGVGKTTLAEMLIYKFLGDDYKLTYIYDDIKDAERVLTPDSEKQIIYFDDFLGSNEVEINKAKGSETSLLKIVRKIKSMENKLLVFTTRSLLLNAAIAESENLQRFNIKKSESVLESEEFNRELKIQLLDNHIDDSEIKPELKKVICSDEIYSFVINHRNFSPRSIEFITSLEVVNELTAAKYKEFIVTSLDSPINIWEHAYSVQIREDDRLLLNTLISFGENAKIDELEKAFQSRIEHEIKTNNKRKESHAFYKAIRRLDSGFILVKNKIVSFINPSLIDFLVNHIRIDQDEANRIAESVVYTSQLTKRLFSLSTIRESKIPESLSQRLLNNYSSFVTRNNRDLDLIRLALVIYKNIKNKTAIDVVSKIIQEIDDWTALLEDYSLNIYFREFMEASRGDGRINVIIENRIFEIMNDLVLGQNDISEASDLLNKLSTDYEVNLRHVNTDSIKDHFEQLIAERIAEEIEWLRDFITDTSEVDEKKNEIIDIIDNINKSGLNLSYNLDEFESEDWFEIALANEFRRLMEKDD